MLLGVLAVMPALSFAADTPVFVPSFIDPQHHIEKPDLVGFRILHFLTSDDYPPFNFAAPDGSLTGFNVDLARAVCEELKIACSIQARSWDTLVPALLDNAGDAIVASLAITEKSREQIDFTVPTMKTPARFAARSGLAPADVLPETVGSRKIGVQVGTAHAAYLAAFFPRATVKTFTDPDSLRAALKMGDIDLMFADGIATALWLNGTGAANCCVFAGGPFTESRYFGEGSGIALRKGDVVLQQAFDYALENLTARGVMADLYLKYFPVGFY
jgi:polar amino acid transport system substrate-binding protein